MLDGRTGGDVLGPFVSSAVSIWRGSIVRRTSCRNQTILVILRKAHFRSAGSGDLMNL